MKPAIHFPLSRFVAACVGACLLGMAMISIAQANTLASNDTNPPSTQTSDQAPAWRPPGVGTDGADWVQLKSGEWLRGEFKFLENKEIEFESDELEMQTLRLKNVCGLYTAHTPYLRDSKG